MNRGGGGSHWEGCEAVHHDCCLAKLSRAEEENARLNRVLRETSRALRHTSEVLQAAESERTQDPPPLCPFCGDGMESVGTLNHIECVRALLAREALA